MPTVYLRQRQSSRPHWGSYPDLPVTLGIHLSADRRWAGKEDGGMERKGKVGKENGREERKMEGKGGKGGWGRRGEKGRRLTPKRVGWVCSMKWGCFADIVGWPGHLVNYIATTVYPVQQADAMCAVYT